MNLNPNGLESLSFKEGEDVKKMVGITDTDVVTVADIDLALHVLLGRPALTQPPRHRAR